MTTWQRMSFKLFQHHGVKRVSTRSAKLFQVKTDPWYLVCAMLLAAGQAQNSRLLIVYQSFVVLAKYFKLIRAAFSVFLCQP